MMTPHAEPSEKVVVLFIYGSFPETIYGPFHSQLDKLNINPTTQSHY